MADQLALYCTCVLPQAELAAAYIHFLDLLLLLEVQLPVSTQPSLLGERPLMQYCSWERKNGHCGALSVARSRSCWVLWLSVLNLVKAPSILLSVKGLRLAIHNNP